MTASRLGDKVAWITGGARGQGRAIACKFAAEGADIVISDVCAQVEGVPYPTSTDADLAETRRLVEAEGRRCVAEIADVRDQAALDRVVAAAIDELGSIDILCANHGIASWQPVWLISDEEWETQLAVNLTGVWHAAKAVAPHMIERMRGCMILTSSTNGRIAYPNMAHYTSAKHGVLGLMKSLALELGPYNVRANAILTGPVHTPMADNPATLAGLFGRTDATTEDYIDATRHFFALRGRSALAPSAVADAMIWLASEEAANVSGLELVLDAGHSILPPFNPNPIVDERLEEARRGGVDERKG
jgi:SDR family mycofactocin-dependent oxidoreductase